MSYKYCPHCGKQLPPPVPGIVDDSAVGVEHPWENSIAQPDGPVAYNQDTCWKMLLEQYGEMEAGETRFSYPGGFEGGTTVIHLLFDKPVAPRGGLMHRMVQELSAQGPSPAKHPVQDLETMGYVTDEDGKVVRVDDVPVSPVYGVLQYWGGERQHYRWHMTDPIEVDPQRKGNPCFIDQNMVAFKATWSDTDKLTSAIEALSGLLRDGLKGSKAVGSPRILDICWVE